MSGAAIDPRYAAPKTPPRKGVKLSWSDPNFRNIVWQVVIIGAVLGVIWFLFANVTRNLEARHIATGFAFLGRVAGIPIGEAMIPYDPAVSTWGRAVIEGILNTLRVAVIGCILATILGTVIGIGRLSKNWLIARITQVYVEVLRDIPVLLQLLFWYSLLLGLPGIRQAFNPIGSVFLTNRGIWFPALIWQDAHSWALAAFLVGLIGVIAYERVAAKRQAETGRKPAIWPAAVGLLVVFPALVWAALGSPFDIDYPARRGFNFAGGTTISPEYVALLLGLVIYTSSYIAEIVRSGIQSVAQGQWEAAGAIGLRPSTALRLVVLPQALRVIIPPMTSQFLNLTKNSSIAVAIGFQDVVSIAGTMLNQTGQAIEGVAIIMAVYLAISLSISAFMNWYNKRIALVER